MCLCNEPSGIVDIVVAAVWVTFGANVGGNNGLQGECDPADVLDDRGTPDDEYKS
jgi:hypothetical protein